jgi:hypothetical protein
MRIFSLVLALLLVTGPVVVAADPASDTATAGQEPPVEYAIELLVFLRDAAPGGEAWPEEVERPSPDQAVSTLSGEPVPEFPPDLRLPAESQDTLEPVGLEALPGANPPGEPEPFVSPVQPLPEDSYQLRPHAETLRRNGLQPLLHTAWRQVVGDRENTDWLWLESGPLYGLVRISLGRYLHIDSDLLLLGPETATGPRQAIRVKDHRRMRSGELHHLDHPGFGILVQIDRYQAAEPQQEPLMLETLGGNTPPPAMNLPRSGN